MFFGPNSSEVWKKQDAQQNANNSGEVSSTREAPASDVATHLRRNWLYNLLKVLNDWFHRTLTSTKEIIFGWFFGAQAN